MKRNPSQQIYRKVGRVGVVVLMFFILSRSSTLFSRGATDTITVANENSSMTMTLLPPVTWLEKQGITLDEFLQRLQGYVNISVANAGFVQVVGMTLSAQLQDNAKKTVEIAVHSAGATRTLYLMPFRDQQITSSQSVGIEVQQAGAVTNFPMSTALRFAPTAQINAGIEVEDAGYTRKLDLIELAWR